MNIPMKEAELIYNMASAKGVTSKTLDGDNKDVEAKENARADLSAGDTANQREGKITRKRGRGSIVFRRALEPTFVKNLGERYLADEADDAELERELNRNTETFLRAKAAKTIERVGEDDVNVICPIYTHVPAKKMIELKILKRERDTKRHGWQLFKDQGGSVHPPKPKEPTPDY